MSVQPGKPKVWSTLLSAYALTVLIGLVDYLTGTEIALSIFYLLPVSLATWRGGFVIGILTALTCAAVWMAAEVLGGHHYSHVAILCWNAGVRLGFFLIVVVSLHLRRKTEASLRSTQQRLSTLFEFAPDPIIVVNGDGLIQQANEQVTKVFGFSRTELLGASIERLLPDRFRSLQPEQPSYLAYRPGQPRRVSPELCGLRKDGSEFPLEVVATPMDAAGRQEVMVILRDFTGRRKLESQLRQHQEGEHHVECEAQITKLKREINATLAETGRSKRYDV